MQRRTTLLPLLLAATLLASCAVHFIAQYDQQIDQGLSEFQGQCDLYLGQRQHTGSPNAQFYEAIHTKLAVLTTRAKSIPLDSLTVKILRVLEDEIDHVQAHDSLSSGHPEFFRIWQETIDQSCQDAIALEISKRRQP